MKDIVAHDVLASVWKGLLTLKEHQKFLANALFQKFLISMVMYEISIIFP